MAAASFTVSVSYSTITVCERGLKDPFNFWTEHHFNQGFAWRPGSANFGTIEGSGQHLVEVVTASGEVPVSGNAARVIEVPFQVPASGVVEIATVESMAGEFPIDIAPGTYALRFECFRPDEGRIPKIRLVFARNDSPAFQILRADPALSPPAELLLIAEPA